MFDTQHTYPLFENRFPSFLHVLKDILPKRDVHVEAEVYVFVAHFTL